MAKRVFNWLGGFWSNKRKREADGDEWIRIRTSQEKTKNGRTTNSTHHNTFEKWLDVALKFPLRPLHLHQIILTFGASFHYALNILQFEELFDIVTMNAENKGSKEMVVLPCVTGTPGIGKTRFLLESLNELKAYAHGAASAPKSLLFNESLLIYASFGNDTPWSALSDQSYFWAKNNRTSPIAARIHWELHFKHTKTSYSQFEQELQSDFVSIQLTESGTKYVVLAFDEINCVPEDILNDLIREVSSVIVSESDRLIGIFAGTICTSLKTAVQASACAADLTPSLLTVSQVELVVDDSAKSQTQFVGWRSAAFRQCLCVFSNPPRALEYFLEVASQFSQSQPTQDIFQFDFMSDIMQETIKIIKQKMGTVIDEQQVNAILSGTKIN